MCLITEVSLVEPLYDSLEALSSSLAGVDVVTECLVGKRRKDEVVRSISISSRGLLNLSSSSGSRRRLDWNPNMLENSSFLPILFFDLVEDEKETKFGDDFIFSFLFFAILSKIG